MAILPEGIGWSQVAGVDEAGRGCLAGPVVAAAVILPSGFELPGLTDSKKLSPARREHFTQIIKAQALFRFGRTFDKTEMHPRPPIERIGTT